MLVAKGNGPAKKAGLVGQTVTLDLTGAKLKVDDVNADGAGTVDDVQVGDKVVVKVKAPRGTTAADTLVARQLVDQTHKEADDDGDDDDVAPEVETETED